MKRARCSAGSQSSRDGGNSNPCPGSNTRNVLSTGAFGATEWDSGPQRARVSGWLMDDYAYDRTPSPWALAHGSTRVSGWEIHPVTRIERWDAARDGWVEVAR